MKKLFFILVACLAINFKAVSQVKFGATIGVTMSNYGIFNVQELRDNGVSVSSTPNTMISAGLVAEIPVAKNFNIQPALNYIQYGTSVRMNYEGEEALRFTVKLNSIELPVNFIYTTQLNKGRLFIGAGPSVTYHLSGKGKSREAGQDETDWNEIKLGSDDAADMRKWNIGANFIAGIELSNLLFFSINYNAGLSNLHSDNKEDKLFTKSHYFGLKVGYFFGLR